MAVDSHHKILLVLVALLSVAAVFSFAGGTAAQSQESIEITISDSTNGEDTETVKLEIVNSEFDDQVFR